MTVPDTPQQNDQRDFNRRLILALEAQGLDYAIGGSVAAMAYSEPRSTIDIDLMIRADHGRLELLVHQIESWNVYVDPVETIEEFLTPNRMPINVVDGISGVKADLYVAQDKGLDATALARRRRLPLYEHPYFEAWFLSPEDVILYKLDYYQQSQGVSIKHPKDIGKMLRVFGAQLELDYIEKWSEQMGTNAVWRAIWDEHNSTYNKH
jgi:hypothetical protein